MPFGKILFYFIYEIVLRSNAVQQSLCYSLSARTDLGIKKRVFQGVPREPPKLILRFGEPLPQITDDINLLIVEIVIEEQRSITKPVLFFIGSHRFGSQEASFSRRTTNYGRWQSFDCRGRN